MNGTDDTAPCTWLKIVEPKQSSRFECPLKNPVDKGFGMRAYENSGDLTLFASELLFVDGRKTVRIPYGTTCTFFADINLSSCSSPASYSLARCIVRPLLKL